MQAKGIVKKLSAFSHQLSAGNFRTLQNSSRSHIRCELDHDRSRGFALQPGPQELSLYPNSIQKLGMSRGLC